MSVAQVVSAHQAAGRAFGAGGVSSFVRMEGDGEAVVCVHGVPASSFLFRKVVGELAARGLRGVAFDLPGLGLAERPERFDYSWSGLGRWCVEAVDALELERFHLVVHDIGGPVGFELANALPERVASLTILNTVVAAESFKRPWMMEPFARRGIGEAWLASMRPWSFGPMMRQVGLGDRRAMSRDEIGAYVDLLKRGDGGKAFLRIMRSFERTAEKEALYRSVVADARRPRQVIWGERDPALPLRPHGEIAGAAAGVEVQRLPAKHFLPEDQAPAIAERVAALVAGSG